MNSFSSIKWMLLISIMVALNAFLVNSDPIPLPIAYKDYKHSPVKRNTWWSKKSLPEDLNFGNAVSTSICPEVSGSEECYMDTCVASFVNCIRMMTELGTSGLHCKLKHRDCVTGCCQDSKELLALTSDMK